MTAVTNPPRQQQTGPMPIVKTAPRRRSVMQGALAVLLIAAGALTAGYVAQRIGSTQDFIGVAKPVGKGAEIKADDLMVIRVNDAVGLKPIPVSRANTVVGKRAAVPLVPGTLLTPEQVTEHTVPGPGNQLLGLSLSEDRLPVTRVKTGANVLLVVTPKRNALTSGDGGAAADLVPPRTIVGTVVDVKPGIRQGDTVVNVEVSTADAPTVAAMHAEDRIVLTLAG